jgi:anti-sigma regulatory factor (Ser/Thr protein kinase)
LAKDARTVETTVVPNVTSRALRVPADRRAPAAAREAVREVLTDSHLDDLLDDALLLATELTTNAVIHVGAEIEIRIEAVAGGVTVSIRDNEPGELPQLGAVDVEAYPFANTGRGLMLVDRIAYRWGTTTDSEGKSVWFELVSEAFVDPSDTIEWATEPPAAGFVTWLRKRLGRQVAET